ncbi:APH(3'') family aminoglycoside O-phosphotransferase [Nocardioides luteus]|uniref:APH(3'') family aminoglycoside O-phosphotransferase n=1 Tax=Nocardioides luteus TaxID=1844 RepID=A0A1J4N7A0_9ACTN|nr:APH(3'') family aminoglycoside O-phosphotransferase [Nocardioides luteus]OIJ27372.1 APH(3'') family aminoglycoside O-phosphotransferase [Nocardioides luteus]
MSVDISSVAGLLPADGTSWEPVTAGESGAVVLHDRDRARYAKLVRAADSGDLAGERDRIIWLGEAGLPAATVLAWRATDEGACLITTTVPGVPADQLDAAALRRAWPAIAAIARQLHALPAPDCPFDRGLGSMMPLARTTVAEHRVQTEFLPVSLQQVPPARILAQLEDQLPQRQRQEETERVVCHGDLCLPNILIDPDTMGVTGLIDLGRLGVADPYADISLLLANARETWPDELTARQADDEFSDLYGIDLDQERQRFYLLLDPLTWPA